MSEELVTIASFATLIRAQEAKLWLEEEGIPTFIADAEFVNMEWALGFAVGGAKVQVPKSRQADAEAVLRKMDGAHARAEQGGGGRQVPALRDADDCECRELRGVRVDVEGSRRGVMRRENGRLR